MKSGKLEVVRGSSYVYRDLGHENVDTEQSTGIAAADFSRESAMRISDSSPLIA